MTTGVIIGWPIEEPGNGRLPEEFVVLARIYPQYMAPSVETQINGHRKTGRYRKVFFVPFDLTQGDK